MFKSSASATFKSLKTKSFPGAPLWRARPAPPRLLQRRASSPQARTGRPRERSHQGTPAAAPPASQVKERPQTRQQL